MPGTSNHSSPSIQPRKPALLSLLSAEKPPDVKDEMLAHSPTQVKPAFTNAAATTIQESKSHFNFQNGEDANSLDALKFETLSTSVTSDNVKGLLTHARRIAAQLQGMVLRDFGLDVQEHESLPTYDQLLGKLQNAFERQREINIANAKLNTVAVVANMATVVKNRTLQNAVMRSRRHLDILRSSVTTLGETVADLSVETSVQKEEVQRLRGSLDATRTVLETRMARHREELRRQADFLKTQNDRIATLYTSRFNQDFIIDFIIFMSSLWAINSALVDYPIRTILSVIGPSGRRKIFARQALKFAILSMFLRTLKKQAVHYGIHNRVGSWLPYASKIAIVLLTQVRKVPLLKSSTIPQIQQPVTSRKRNTKITKASMTIMGQSSAPVTLLTEEK